MKKEFFAGIYCPPSCGKAGYPNRITNEVFGLLAKAGIRQIYGYYDDEQGMDTVHKLLDLSAEHGMVYYPRLKVFDQFLGERGNEKFPLFTDMSKEKQEAVKKDFIDCIDAIKDHPAFGGIFISDERPLEAYEGMAVAREIFAKKYPNKEFHYNALNYFGDDKTMFYRNGDSSNRKYMLTGELEYNSQNRFSRYRLYMNEYLDVCAGERISTDLYPFAPTWKNVPTSIHRGGYEINYIMAEYRRKKSIPCYLCIQVGDWDKGRYIGRPETALHMNLIMAYQLDGFIFFPGVYPNDWLGDEIMKGNENGINALLDAMGKPTEHYGYVQRLLEHAQSCADVLLNSEWNGVYTIGEFEGGFGDVDLDEVEWNECIYRGGLPEGELFEYCGTKPEIDTESQLFVGVFENTEDDVYFVVNNSIVKETTFVIKTNGTWKLTIDGKCVEGSGDLKVTSLNAGESIMLEVKK